MEQRKLIKLGNSSFAIALPKGWIEKSGLKKGESIFVQQNSNGELIISSSLSEQPNDKKISINTENKNFDMLKREVRAAYIKGYTSFDIKGIKTRQDKENVKKILNNFLSFELIDSNENELVAKDFFNLENTALTSFIRRIDNNIREIFEIVLGEIKKEKFSLVKIKNIEEIDEDINKFYFLCSRIFMRGLDNPSLLTKLKTNGIKLFNEWWFAFNLEALADGLKYVMKSVAKQDSKKTREKISEILEKLQKAYFGCMDAFYKDDSSIALNITELTTKIRGEIQMLEKEDIKLSPLSNHLNYIQKQIYQNARMVLYVKY